MNGWCNVVNVFYVSLNITDFDTQFSRFPFADSLLSCGRRDSEGKLLLPERRFFNRKTGNEDFRGGINWYDHNFGWSESTWLKTFQTDRVLIKLSRAKVSLFLVLLCSGSILIGEAIITVNKGRNDALAHGNIVIPTASKHKLHYAPPFFSPLCSFFIRRSCGCCHCTSFTVNRHRVPWICKLSVGYYFIVGGRCAERDELTSWLYCNLILQHSLSISRSPLSHFAH